MRLKNGGRGRVAELASREIFTIISRGIKSEWDQDESEEWTGSDQQTVLWRSASFSAPPLKASRPAVASNDVRSFQRRV